MARIGRNRHHLVETNSGPGPIIIDANGNPGSPTPISGSSSFGLLLKNGALVSAYNALSAANIVVNSNTWIVVSNYSGLQASITCSAPRLRLAAASRPTGSVTPSGAGNSYGSSPSYPCSGAGYGGYGGNSIGNLAAGGRPYDSQTSPVSEGSPGGSDSPYSLGGAGGGSYSMSVSGTLQVDGLLTANGLNGSGLGGGGGSGGTIKLTVGTLSGGGVIRANGGSGVASIGGGGAGGCIYLNPTSNIFAGTISAYGGNGANWGGAGSIFTEAAGQNAQIILDGGGNPGATTPLVNNGSTGLTLRNGAYGIVTDSVSLGNVVIASNGWMMVSNQGGLTTLTVSSLSIQPGGGITADAEGYAGGQGTGAGQSYGNSPNYPCGGAGHGGLGGNSVSNLALGGNAYDTQGAPSQSGSGGGTDTPYSQGGAGGGAVVDLSQHPVAGRWHSFCQRRQW